MIVHYLILLAITFPGTAMWAMVITWTYRWCVIPQWSTPEVSQHQVMGAMVMLQTIHLWASPTQWYKSKPEAKVDVSEFYTAAFNRYFVGPLITLACAWIYAWLFL
jgi:hypothetical protein